MGTRTFWSAVGVVLCMLLVGTAGYAAPTELISVSDDGVQADADSSAAAISADGRFVAFDSLADNLVSDDTNGNWDVFVRDRVAGRTERISIGIFGEANGASRFPSISADGRFVAFVSNATNLVFGDTNLSQDVFVRDRTTDQTILVSAGALGFPANGASGEAAISADGDFVAFSSFANNLVENDFNLRQDVFVRDLRLSTTTLVSVSSDGVQGNGASGQPSISGDGRLVAFTSLATNLVAGDVNFVQDVFVRDLEAQQTEVVSVSTTEVPGNDLSAFPSISEDGRFVAFESFADDLVSGDEDLSEDIFVRDLTATTTEEASPVGSCGGVPCGDSYDAAINKGGRFVAFTSVAPDLVPDDTNGVADVFVTDRTLLRILRMSVANDGTQGNGDSFRPAITQDGESVAFISAADNLVADDRNFSLDVFVRKFVTFPDVPVDDPDFLAIEEAVMAGIVNGFGDGLFKPDLTLNRAQLAVFIARAVAGGESQVPAGPDQASFSDVPPDFWAFRHIEFLAKLDIVLGFPGGRFHPELQVNRAQMAVFVARAIAGGDAGVPSGPATATFSDVPADFWAFKYIEFLARRDLVQAVQDDLFGPGNVVTRREMVVLVARAFDLPPLTALE